MSQASADDIEMQKQEMWQRVVRVRGFGLGLHKVMAEADWEFMKRLEEWAEFVYVSDRHMERRVKEFVVIGILAALRSPPEHIQVHISAAVSAGATKEELIVVAELVGQGGGAVARANAIDAWRRVFAPEMPSVFHNMLPNPQTSANVGSHRDAETCVYAADRSPNADAGAEPPAQLEQQKRQMTQRVLKTRGFGFGLHAVLAEADWEFMKKLEEWVEFVYLSERHIDRRVKELVITGVLGALRSSPDHIQAHIDAGVKAGATRDEVILVAELVGFFSGSDGLISVVEAWRRAFAPDLPPVFKPQHIT